MAKPTFQEIAWVLSDFFSDTDALLRATARVEDMVNDTYPTQPVSSPDGKAHWDGYKWVYSHDHLVDLALNYPEIINSLVHNRKIEAIKKLRTLTNCGLKPAKDAVEDNRVSDKVYTLKYTYPITQSEEPPF